MVACFSMAIRECRVTFHDLQGVDHSITIHAETTLEAAAIALRRITEQGFVESEYADSITVELTTTTTHTVSLKRTLCDKLGP
jgi:hypothetical protein